jgi:hypothetical protein
MLLAPVFIPFSLCAAMAHLQRQATFSGRRLTPFENTP